jgi:hypothetical protein
MSTLTNNAGSGGDGVLGITTSGTFNGVFGRNDSTDTAAAPHGGGVFGLTLTSGGCGVFGANNNPTKGTGVQGNGPEVGVGGFSNAGSGMLAQSNQGSGLVATSAKGQGISAFSDNDVGVFAQGATFSGVFNGAFVVNKGPNPKDTSIKPSDINGSIVINDGNLFVNSGSVFVTKGDVVLQSGDCAEDFGVAMTAEVDPGTVMVLNGNGELSVSDSAYNKRVAGVISGAGNYKPGLVLDRHPEQEGRMPIALMGKVCCKVDARYGSVDVGDLLTTSPTPGHAMKAIDAQLAFGAVIGKALRPLEEGQGLIPVLVALQ